MKKIFSQLFKSSEQIGSKRFLGTLSPFKAEEILANYQQKEELVRIVNPISNKLSNYWENNQINKISEKKPEISNEAKRPISFTCNFTPQFWPLNNYETAPDLKEETEQVKDGQENNNPTINPAITSCVRENEGFFTRNSKPIVFSSLSVNGLAIIALVVLLTRKRKTAINHHSLQDCRKKLFAVKK